MAGVVLRSAVLGGDARRSTDSKPMHERRTRYELQCRVCGAKFTATRPDAMYCSSKCRLRAHRHRQQSAALTVQPLETRIFSGHPIQRRRADGWVNATAMCQAGGREWFTYARASRTQEYIAALAGVLGSPQNCGDPFAGSPQNPATVVIQSITTGPNHLRGTWIHPRLAVDLARWISPEFAVWMDGWILGQFERPTPTTCRISTVHGLAMLLPAAIERYHRNRSDDLAKVIAESAMYIALMYNNPGPAAALELGLAGNRFIRDSQ